MRQIRNLGDDRQGTWCVHCGTTSKGSRDHIPSKSFLDRPYPQNLPTLDICDDCNKSFSIDEEYVACAIECIACGTTDPDGLSRTKIAKSLRSNEKLKNRIHRSKSRQLDLFDKDRILWNVEIERVSAVLLKNARGHVLYELNEQPPSPEPDHSLIYPICEFSSHQRHHFERAPKINILPEIGSRSFQRILSPSGLANDWIVVQQNRYRYMTAADENIMVRMVIRECLAAEFIWGRS